MSKDCTFYSTENRQASYTLKEAILLGLAPDGGLFMPHHLPKLDKSFLQALPSLSFCDIALHITRHLFGDTLPASQLNEIIRSAFDFPLPLVQVEEDLYSLETFHGPTLSFKDFGARFMARLMGYFQQKEERCLHILVATSGDTGSAVAHGFLGVANVHVWLLYPSGKTSHMQEQQMATLGQNITALKVDGSFDCCQALVKRAFRDQSLREELMLSSANSINIARLIPQCFYYFYAAGRCNSKEPPQFSVPSGNFGNLTAGLLAQRLGLRTKPFIASTNANDVVPDYLNTGTWSPRPSVQTLSNAMDVGNPSNFSRILDLFDGSYEQIRSHLQGSVCSDEQTRQTIAEVYEQTGYVLDPHGAVAYHGLQQLGVKGPKIFLESAHPAKFTDLVKACIGQTPPLPERLKSCLQAKNCAEQLPNDYSTFRERLLTQIFNSSTIHPRPGLLP